MAKKPERMDDDKLIQILRKEEMAAKSFQDTDLMSIREDALDYYDGEPYGDEQEGASQIVTSEFADVIESLMPSMMRVFAGSDQVAEFTPSAPGEEKWAAEATRYVPHVFMRQNDGYRIIYWLVKDALMYRLGGMTVDVEDYEETKDFPVKGLQQHEIDILLAKEAEVEGAKVELDLTQDNAAPPSGESNDLAGGMTPLQGGAILPPMPTFSGTITITKPSKRVIADNIAPEDIRFTPTARDQDKASYLGYLRKTTASELVDMLVSTGMGEEEAREEVETLRSDRDISPEENQRNDAAILNANQRSDLKDSERVLWLVVAYVRADFDNDGSSTMERVVYAHAGGTVGRIVERMPWEGLASMALVTPILMPHTIVGRGIFDQTQDLQQIGSVLTRGYLDNLYMSNRPRAVASDKVEIASLLDWTPGSPIRLKAGASANVGEHVSWLQPPVIGQSVLQGLEYFKTVREERTGVVRNNQGLDADSLNKTASGMNLQMGAAQARTELLARTVAETGIKRIYQLVYRAIKKAASAPVKYWDGQNFCDCDPTQWPEDMELSVNVGAGTRDQALQGLAAVGAAQEKLILLQGNQANGPYVTPDNVANLTQKMTEAMGFKTSGLFFQPPEKVMQAVQAQQGKPPPVDPKVQHEQMRAQADIAATEAKHKAEMEKMQAQGTLQAQKDAAHKEHLLVQLAIERARGVHQGQQNAFTAHTDHADRTHDVVLAGLGAIDQATDHAHDLKMAAAKPKPNGGAT